ncbi:MAG TPA: ABC transporter ATP-binding protein [Methanomassiliicoccales archaeon]|nr:ABC transporter ATP-binding protein [Methanomassiliicoccales archaeon]
MSQPGEVGCSGISKLYGDGKRALTSVSFTIPAKGIFAVIGRNGAGKTTLARIMSTLLEPTSGTAWIDGVDVMVGAKKLRERMAVVPQEGRTVAWMTPQQTVSSYLLWRGLSYKEAKNRAEEAVARVGLERQANVLNRRLSGGMKRKVLVAMAVASDAEFIFLDEPSTGLDPISRKELWALLTELGRERFLFLTTHYLEEAEEVADRVAILDRGRLLALGSLDELRRGLRYQFSLRVPYSSKVEVVEGEVIARRDGQQIVTTKEEAQRISKRLVEEGMDFSVNPVALNEIFDYTVARAGNRDEREDED